jgi:uncharacterized membrane protein (DUF106 family)
MVYAVEYEMMMKAMRPCVAQLLIALILLNWLIAILAIICSYLNGRTTNPVSYLNELLNILLDTKINGCIFYVTQTYEAD